MQSSKLLNGFVKALATVEGQIDKVLDINGQSGNENKGMAAKTSVADAAQWLNWGDGMSFITPGSIDKKTTGPAPVVSSVDSTEQKAVVSAPKESVTDKHVVTSTSESIDKEAAVPAEIVVSDIPVPVVVEDNAQPASPGKDNGESPDDNRGNILADNSGEILKQREEQLLKMMKENAELVEDKERSESKVALLMKQLEEMESKVSIFGGNNQNASELQVALKSREEQVKQLMEEGQKLSEFNGKLHQAVKKIKAKEQETQNALNALQEKYVSTKNECANLTEKVSQLEESEKQHLASVQTANETNLSQAKQISKLEEELRVKKDQLENLQKNLDAAWHEVNEIKKQQTEINSQVESESLKKQQDLNAELLSKVELLKKDNESMKHNYEKELSSLRSSLVRSENDIGWKEDQHRKEIALYQQRIQDAEARNEELTASIQDSAKPFIRQINALKTQQAQSQQLFENVEKSLTQRLSAAETEKITALNNLKHLEQRVLVLEAQLKAEKEAESKHKLSLDSLRNELNRELELREDLQEKIISLENKLSEIETEKRLELEEVKASAEIVWKKRFEEESRDMMDRIKVLERSLQDKEKDIERLREFNNLKEGNAIQTESPAPRVSRDPSISSPTSASKGTLFDHYQQNHRVATLEAQISSLRNQLEQSLQQKGKYFLQ